MKHEYGQLDTQNLKNNYGDRLAPRIAKNLSEGIVEPKDPVDPIRFSAVDLMEREASYGRSGFNLQFHARYNPLRSR